MDNPTNTPTVGQLERQLEVERAVSGISSLLLTSDQVDMSIVVDALGNAVDVDRAYICILSRDGLTIESAHAWQKPGSPPFTTDLRGMHVQDFTWWMDSLHGCQLLAVEDTSQIPESAVHERALFEMHGSKALLAVPICSASGLLGFLGFDDTTALRTWSESEVHLLRTAANCLAAYLQRQQTMSELRTSEERFHAFMNNSPMVAYIKDDEGRHVYANNLWEVSAGLSPDEWPGKTSAEIWPLEFSERIDELDALVMATDGPIRQIEIVPDPDGTPHQWLSIKFPIHASSGKRFLGGISLDISDHVRTSEALRRSDETNRAVLSAIPDLVFRVSKDGIFLDTNRQTHPNLYLPAGRFLGRSVHETLPSELADLTMQCIDAVMQTRQMQTYEYTLDIQGEPRVFEARMVPCGQDEVLSIARDVTEQRRSEDSLRLAQFVVDHSADGIRLVGSDGRFLYSNAANHRMFGYSAEELHSMRVHDIDPSLTEAAWAERWAEINRRGAITFETTQRTKGGSLLHVEITSNSLPSGGEEYLCSIVRDITARKRMEETIEARARQQAMIAELGQCALAGMDVESLMDICTLVIQECLGVEYVGIAKVIPDTGAALLVAGIGWKPGTIGTASLDIEAGTHVGYVLGSSESVVGLDIGSETRFAPSEWLLQHGVVSHANVTIRDGDRHWGALSVYTTSPRVFDDYDVYFLSAISNILASAIKCRRTEDELRIQTSAVNAVNDQIIIVDPEGLVEFVNPAFTLSTGYPAEGLVGTNISELMSDAPDSDSVLQSIIASGYVWQGELMVRRKDGEIRIEDLTVTPVRDGNGAIRHLAAILRDVTERKAYEERMNQARKMETVGKLAAGIAHDFNNLLQMILGYAHVMMDEIESEHLRKDLAAIETACLRAASLVRQILTFSRQVPPCKEPVDVAALARETAELLQNTFPRTIEIICNVPEQHLVLADSSQIQQVLMNLCLNARDAMPFGGRLQIAVDRVMFDDAGSTSWTRRGEFVRCTIEDNGCGMDYETRRRAFEPFYTTKPLAQGTGLGLSTCYGIVENHDGLIHIESQVCVGTKVTVYLPATDQPLTVAEPRGLSGIRNGTQTILVVEDEGYLRELTGRILENHGYSVLQASNGREALECLGRCHQDIQLVLLDLNMAEMDGMQTLPVIRRSYPSVKVLVNTGLDAAIQDLPDEDRPDGVLRKPHTPAMLLDSLGALLAGT